MSGVSRFAKRLVDRLDPGTWSVKTFVTVYIVIGAIGILGGLL